MRKLAVITIAILLAMAFMPMTMNMGALNTVGPKEFVISDSVEPPSGLVSWWPGDGNAFDVVGINNGELQFDTSFTPGLVDDAFSFDGNQDHVWARGFGIDELQELTMELWVKHDPLSELGTNRYITLGNEKAVLRHDRGGLNFYMNLGGLHHSETASLVEPTIPGYSPFTGDPINPTQFSFMYISGLHWGDWISLTGEFNNRDSDFMAWPGNLREEDYSYGNNILGTQMTTSAIPETGGLYWEFESDVLVVGCFDYSIQPGEWTLTVDKHYLHHIRVPVALQASRWYHVAGTYDGSFMRLYLDGTEVDYHEYSAKVMLGDGVIFSDDGEELHGLLDEISIYRRALSAEEIRTVFEAGNDGKCKPIDDYNVYSAFEYNADSVSGVGGWVPDYGDPNVWGDEEQYLYFLAGQTGYKVKVWLTDYELDHPGEDTSPGWIEPHQHPENPYATGPIEPRHFEINSSVDLSPYIRGLLQHTDEFYVDASGVYVGAYPNGIHKWDHSWNYIGKIANAPPGDTPWDRTESLAYNPDDNVWYAGGRYRTIYQLSDSGGDGSFLNDVWISIFDYPDYGGGHHDGMEYVAGYLWISDMTSDVIGQWYYDAVDGWEEKNRFTYNELGWVEGMGFGPNNHFWAASLLGIDNQLPYLYEFGGGELQKELPPFQVFIDIKPESWPNPINLGKVGVLPVAICGTEDFDVTTIDPGTIVLAFEGEEGVVGPLRWSYEDVATPFDGEPFDGHELAGDGYMDLVLHFATQEVVYTFRLFRHGGQTKPIYINGNLKEEYGGKEIQGRDYARITGFLDDAPYIRGIRYLAPWPDYLAPHVAETGTWVTIAYGFIDYGATPEEAEQNLRGNIAESILEITLDGTPLRKLDSGYLWEHLDISEEVGYFVAIVRYSYYLHPQPAGTYEIHWSWWDPWDIRWYRTTGYLTWISEEG